MKTVPVGVSGRHIHLTKEHIEMLFGKGYQLTPLKPLSQPGQFAAQETVKIIGPKGFINKVRILGPARPISQLEISRTDCFTIGVEALVRDSGNIDNTPGVLVRGPVGEVKLKEGLIVAARHLHLHTSDAANWRIQDKQKLRVRVGGERGITFENVIARVSDKFALDMHIDTDEANASGLENGDKAEIVGE